MNHLYNISMSSPLGPLGVLHNETAVVGLLYAPKHTLFATADNAFSTHIRAELCAYFNDPNHNLALPVQLIGTPFQISVWEALQQIPVGQTVTYKEIATRLNTSPRAVGNACRDNPVPVIIPCHRVIAQKHIGGYSGKREGDMLDIKTWLLAHEKKVS